jgi:hypothetical protein
LALAKAGVTAAAEIVETPPATRTKPSVADTVSALEQQSDIAAALGVETHGLEAEPVVAQPETKSEEARPSNFTW